METDKIISFLGKKAEHRIDIYFAPKKIDKYYKDLGFHFSEASVSANEGAEFGASLFEILSFKVKEGNTISEKIILDYRDKGRLIEEKTREEIRNNKEKAFEIKQGLVHFSGNGQFTIWGDKFDLLHNEDNALVEQERKIQEKIMELPTAIFSFKIDNKHFVSIAKKENFDLGILASYRSHGPFGILGLIERKLSENLLLINPFWIWRDEVN